MTQLLIGMHLTQTGFMIALLLIFSVLGAFVESLGIIVITVPLLYPVLNGMGIDAVWFGIVLVLFIEMGQITPPIGINLFVIQALWNGKLSDVVAGSIPFHLLMFAMLGLLVMWPEIALWLPTHMIAR
jgi:TRAP-type C4-dicarboxylate transport system permease large subunit